MSGPKPLNQNQHDVVCVFSHPGSGKTRLLGTCAELGKVLRLAPPTTRNNAIRKRDKSKVDEWLIHDHAELQEALEFLRTEGEQYDWVWWDDVGLWSDVGLDDLWETVILEKPHRARFGLDQAEYNINATRIARWVRYAIGPDKFNFGMTFHAEKYVSPIKDEDGDAIELLMPWIQVKQMPNKMAGMCNLVCYLEVNDRNERVLHTQASDVYYGKNDYDEDGKDWAIKNPTMPALVKRLDKVRGSGTSSGSKSKKTTGKKRRSTTRK
jgi:hypothetical protein